MMQNCLRYFIVCLMSSFLFGEELPVRELVFKSEAGFEEPAAKADQPAVDQGAEDGPGFDTDKISEAVEEK